mgnify:CR=1 FL=1
MYWSNWREDEVTDLIIEQGEENKTSPQTNWWFRTPWKLNLRLWYEIGFLSWKSEATRISGVEREIIVVDDWQYMSSFEYFDRANEKGYDKFIQIEANLAQVVKLLKDLRVDLIIIFLTP